MKAPRAPQKKHTVECLGFSWEDPWFWLRDKEQAGVMEYLREENAFTKSVLQPHAPQQEALFKEMRGRIQEKDNSVPSRDGGYWYYFRYEQGGQYPIYCRKKTNLDNAEEVLLDLNGLAKGKKFLELGAFSYSPDHRYLAYSLDESGDEKYTLYIKDTQSGKLLEEKIPEAYTDVAWAADKQTFFYTVLDPQLRPLKVKRHRLGDDPQKDVVVYEEKDPRFFVGVGTTLSQAYILIHIEGSHVSEEYFLPSHTPQGEFTCVAPRQEGVEYSAVHHGEHFYIHTNHGGAKDFKIVKTRVATPGCDEWQDAVAHSPGTLVRSVEAFKNHLVVESSVEGLPRISIYLLGESLGEKHEIQFEEPVYSVRTGGYREFDSKVLRFSYQSLKTPPTSYDYDMESREKTFLKQVAVLGGFDSKNYVCRREFAVAEDGTQVPLSIVFHKDTPLDGSAPLFLNGYGSYGLSRPASFSSSRLCLLDRGFVFALAHIRGGMEMGWDWYQNGKLLKKKNTFGDFIACAEHLIQKKYTSQGQLVASGGSAGGMLMGVIANERPELFNAIVAQVPFVDVLNTMLDETLTLTPIEFKEWGNPKEREYFEYIRSYSPYDNVKKQNYPNMYISGGLNDPRVTYWEPAKWAAKLREYKTDDNLLLLKINMGAGHGGASGRFEYLKELAEEYTFVLKVCEKL